MEAARLAAFEREVEAAVAEVEAGVKSSRADGWTDDLIHEDDLYHDIAINVTFALPPAVAEEVRRRLGFLPADF